MSIGRPQSFAGLVSTPPDRGSFPLDHYGECKDQMKAYLACLQKNGATSTPCRALNKNYLECRMSKGLMQRDDWQNLGLDNVDNGEVNSSSGASVTCPTSQSDSASAKSESKR